LTVTIKGLLNPTTVKPAGNLRITTVMRYTTPANGRYYPIDSLEAPSNFQATVGTIDPASISIPGVTANTQMTFAEMQTYLFTFTTKHAIHRGGFVKVVIPRAFTVVYPSTTTAQFQCMKDDINYCSVFTTSAGKLDITDPTDPAKNEPAYVIGLAKLKMLPNTKFTLRIAGLQNPRYVIEYADVTKGKSAAEVKKAEAAMHWQIQTFGPAALSSAGELALDEQMDVGTGGYVDVKYATPITSFSAEAKNATNGVETTYYLTWSTVLRTL
jgi:hypothetical protein